MARMDVTSLAWRTDIAILAASGSTVTDCGTHLLVTTPDNPSYHWGNFLLLKHLPVPGGAREVMGAYDTWFRTNRYRAIGIDSSAADEHGVIDTSEFERAGMDTDVSHVMVAERLRAPARPFLGGGIRPLAFDEWDKWADLELAVYADDRRYTREYVRARARQEQRLVDAGLGQRWGVFVDGRLAASAAVYDTGNGVLRFQSVATHPRRRKQGIASTLLHRMTERAIADHVREGREVRGFVTVADPEGPAHGAFKRLGLATLETVTELNQNLPGQIA